MGTDRESFWQEGGARNCQMVGVILSNHSHELRIHIRLSVRIKYPLYSAIRLQLRPQAKDFLQRYL